MQWARELGGRLADAAEPDARQGFIRLCSPLELQKYRLSNTARNPERDEYVRRVLAELTSGRPWRRFSFPADTLEQLEQLKPKVGNFGHVLECVMDAISLPLSYRKPITITPMLGVGEPGLGKSYFTYRLAGSLGVPLRRVAMDNLQVGPSLAGSSYVYYNSETGTVFNVLTQKTHISSVIILDEIDNADGNFANSDALGPLHNLLEPESAKVFQDASANYIDEIPATIRSRFEVFEIGSPGHGERLSALKGICEELVGEYPGIEFNDELLGKLMGRTLTLQSPQCQSSDL